MALKKNFEYKQINGGGSGDGTKPGEKPEQKETDIPEVQAGGVSQDTTMIPEVQLGSASQNTTAIPGVQLGGASQNTATQSSQTEQPSTVVPPSAKGNTFQNDPYVESNAVRQAKALLEQHNAKNPGAYQSQWQSQIDGILDKILNRKKFSYDLNGDALYQQYKDQYTTLGKMAMMDTMGQAQAMTGGYGNSYAQSVGQQAYQGYLQQLNDVVPELYQLALDQYHREGDELYNQYGLYADRENQNYGRYRDQMADYLDERSYLTGRYDAERDLDYGKWANERDFAYGKFADDKAYAVQAEEDNYNKLVDMMTTLGYQPSADEVAAAGMSEAQAQSFMDYYTKQNTPSYSGQGKGVVPVAPLTAEEIQEIEDTANVYAHYGEEALMGYLEYKIANENLDQDIAYAIYDRLFPKTPVVPEVEGSVGGRFGKYIPVAVR